MSAVIGSKTMELEKGYRLMMLEVARRLSTEECDQIAYYAGVKHIVSLPVLGHQDFRINLIHTLESQGLVNPLELQLLEEILPEIGRHDLLETIKKYKSKRHYKDAKKKKERTKAKTKQQAQAAQSKASSRELLESEDDSDAKRIELFRESFRIFLTQFAQMAVCMRSSLETNNLANISYAFETVVDNGHAVTRTLRKTLNSVAGINRLSSSGEGSGVDTSSHQSSSSSEASPSPVMVTEAGSEPQQHQYRVFSPTASYPVKHVYSHPTSSTSLTPYHRVSAFNSGDNTGDDSGYGCSGNGQGCLSYVPSSEALAKINPDNKGHNETDFDGGSRHPRHYTKLQIGQQYASVYTKLELPQDKSKDELDRDAKGDYKGDFGRQSRQNTKSQIIWPEYSDTYAHVTLP